MTQKALFVAQEDEAIRRAAEISECGKYRWWLRRSWGIEQPAKTVCFIMLNPSTADDLNDDPTIRRCIRFAKAWDCSVLEVRNLFAFRATDPKDLKRAGFPTGGDRGDLEIIGARDADLVVCAWGANAPDGREKEALNLLGWKERFCLGTTRDGKPRHPLYVPGSQELVPYKITEV